MDPVFQLLTELSVDPFQLDRFMRDPDPLMAELGMDPAELPALARPDTNVPAETWARCAACFDPGYDPLPDPDLPPIGE
jgi:hypothetical protein